MSDIEREEYGDEEKAQMVGLLRHFAEKFGAGEVYREARAILLESPEGGRVLEEEYGRVRDEARAEQSRQSSPSPWGGEGGSDGRGRSSSPPKGGGRESKLEEARRLLGG